MTENVVLWVLGAAVAVIVWAVRVEAKVQAHDRDVIQLHAELHEFRADLKTDMVALRGEVHYIRQRIDACQGRDGNPCFPK